MSDSTPAPPTPSVAIVGRGPELRELEEALDRAISTGTPQAVTLIGSAGIGKTRLLHDFLERVRARPPLDDGREIRAFRGVCHENAPGFSVVQRILRGRFGIADGAGSDQVRETFRTAVTQSLGDVRVNEFLHFLGAYLDLDFVDSPFTKAMEVDPTEFQLVSRAVLRRFFEVDARRTPLVLTFEDLHWCQDDGLDLVQYLLGSLREAPVLLVCVARPELLARRAEWGRASHHTRLELTPLSPDDAAQLMYKLLEPAGDVPDELIDAAVDIAGGSPYLLEQMVRAFFDSGTLRKEDDGTWSTHLDRLDEAQLPLTVEDAISARISSLTPAERELLEKASAMGGVFWLGALVALSRIDAKTPDLWGGHESLVSYFQERLESLAERDYVLPMPDSSIPGETEFAFKHNLERETLHKLTNRTKMRRFHRIVAEWLEFKLPASGETSRGEAQLEMLAQHHELGGSPQRAAYYYLDAGNKARARYANSRAADYYERGLSLLDEEEVPRRLEALHHWGDVLQLAGHNDQAQEAFRKMLEIAFRYDLKAKGGVAHNRLGRLFRSIGHLDEAMRHLGTGQALFVAADDARGVASSVDDIGKVHWMRGSYEAAERFMSKALEMRRELGDRRSIALSLNNLGLVFQDSGRFGEAKSHFEEALEIRRQIEDQQGVAQTLNNLGTIHTDDGEHRAAITVYEEALDVARSVGDRMRQAIVLTNLGEARYRLGEPQGAIETLQEAEALSATLGDRILEGEILRGLAKAHMLTHDHQAARDYIARSIELFEQARGKPFLGVALRTLGEITAAAGWGGVEYERAREAFEKSIQLFEELGNEIELASSLETYAAFLEGDDERKGDAVVAGEINQLRARADLIRQRLRESATYMLPELDDDLTVWDLRS